MVGTSGWEVGVLQCWFKGTHFQSDRKSKPWKFIVEHGDRALQYS